MKKIADHIIEELNEEQFDAVTHTDGPLLIVAGAGTGKTWVITRRIAYLIVSGIARPEEILALTFTDKAAEEMEERVDILVPYGYTEISISTFHSFGDRLIKEHALELGLPTAVKVLSQAEQIILFKNHLFEFPLDYYRPRGDPTHYISAILKLISRAKDEDVSPGEYLEYARGLRDLLKKDPGNKELEEISRREMEVASTYARYEELLEKEGKVDFGNQVGLALKLLRQHPAILAKYQERFRYILVDEFQDTNHAQFELVKLLSQKHKNVCVSGDDDQAVYKFRGAALSNVMNFMDVYPQAKKIVLNRSYRSTQVILDAAYRLIKYNDPDRLEVKENIDKHLTSLIKEDSPVRHFHYDSLSAEADGVASIIKEKVKKKEYSWGDFAVLVRANDDADQFLKSFNMEDIPWRFSGNAGLYSREEVRIVISFLRVISNLIDSVSLYHLAMSPIYEFPPQDLTLCLNYAHRRNRSLFFVFTHLSDIPELNEEMTPEAKAAIDKIIKDIDKYVKLSSSLNTGELVYRFLTDSGFLKNLMRSESAENEEKIQNIARFFEIIRSTSRILEHDRINEFVRHLDLLIDAGDNPAVSEADWDVNAVNVLTIHKAKGLEFPVVIMVSLVTDHFPSRERKEPIALPNEFLKQKERWLPQGDPHIQEERRLFYVGMTRAKRELLFTSSLNYGGKRLKKISRFVLETLNLPKQEAKVIKFSAAEAIGRFSPREEEPDLFTRGSLPEKEILHLSYFQIDDYLTCPLKYKYVHILKVPVVSHHAVVYGKAIHDAIQEYYRIRLSGKPVSIEDLILVFENSWSSEGFLTQEHEARRFEEGKKALKDFYRRAQEEKELPLYIEKEFNFNLENNRITGRWDRIDAKGEDAVIIDFKSSDIREQDRADKRAEDSLQLAIYALAYKEIFNVIPKYVELHFVESGLIGRFSVDERLFEKTAEKIKAAAAGIRGRIYGAKPSFYACNSCAFQYICPHTLKEI